VDEVRAAFAIARKDIRSLLRYRIAVASNIFTPLYQFIIPAFLFGTAFAVNGHATGLATTLGTDDLAGYIFFGGIVGAIISTAFWGMAMSIRNEMDMGTLEPSWLTPTSHATFILGRALGGLFFFTATEVVLFAFGIVFLGLRLKPEMIFAVPAVVLAILAMIGVAYALAAIVLLIREANFFIDTANFAFATITGVSFPITLLPGILQPIALMLPTTYAVDILRAQALGSRPLFDIRLEYAVLAGLTVVLFPLGRFVFARAELTMRRRGMLAQY
jgi:ABC-2 type transport system permease protein